MAVIYVSSTLYNSLSEETLSTSTYPSSTNYEAIENIMANYLHSKIGIEDAITADPALSTARLWVFYAIVEFSQFNKGRKNYVSPKDFIEMPNFLERMEKYNFLLEAIENTLDNEKAPAGVYELNYYGGGHQF